MLPSGAVRTANGSENAAFAADPPSPTPPPATVRTTPRHVTDTIRPDRASVRSDPPVLSATMPTGSTRPYEASTDTVRSTSPSGRSRTIRLLERSAAHTTPPSSTPRPHGSASSVENASTRPPTDRRQIVDAPGSDTNSPPAPSGTMSRGARRPSPGPARMCTAPAPSMRSTLDDASSTTNKAPSPSASTPTGRSRTEPVPTVRIVPVGSMVRTAPLPVSATHTVPSGAAQTSAGASSRASVAGPPSPAQPARPVPAIVWMVPSGSTCRTRWCPGSARIRAPPAVWNRPVGRPSTPSRAGRPSPTPPPARTLHDWACGSTCDARNSSQMR